MDNINIVSDFVFNPQKYISYNKLVNVAIKDYRPASMVGGLMSYAVQPYPSERLGQAIIFKEDGAKVHKKLSDSYIMVAPTMLQAYNKSASEFWDDWNNQHKR